MRTTLLIILAFASSAAAQSVHLRVATVSEGAKTTSNSGGYGAYQRTQSHGVELKVTLRNMHNAPHTYTVEWNFYAKDLETRKTRVHDSGTNSVPLRAGETKTFEIQSAQLTSETTGYAGHSYAHQRATGEKSDGYLVLVKSGDRLLAVEASDATLKRSYMDAINAARLQPKPAVKPPPPAPAPR